MPTTSASQPSCCRRCAARVAACATYGCSLRHLRLQPPPPALAACATYGCSLRHLRLQALLTAALLVLSLLVHLQFGWRTFSRVASAKLPLRSGLGLGVGVALGVGVGLGVGLLALTLTLTLSLTVTVTLTLTRAHTWLLRLRTLVEWSAVFCLIQLLKAPSP